MQPVHTVPHSVDVGYVQVHQTTALIILRVLCALSFEAVTSCGNEGAGIKDDQLTVRRGCVKSGTKEVFIILGTLQWW